LVTRISATRVFVAIGGDVTLELSEPLISSHECGARDSTRINAHDADPHVFGFEAA